MPEQQTEEIIVQSPNARHSNGYSELLDFDVEHPAEQAELGSGVTLIENEIGALAFIRQRALDLAHQRLVLSDDDGLSQETTRFHADLLRRLEHPSSMHSDGLKHPVIQATYFGQEVNNDVLSSEFVALICDELEHSVTLAALQDAVELLQEQLNESNDSLAAEMEKKPRDIIDLELQLAVAVGEGERASEIHVDDVNKLGDKDIVISDQAEKINRLKELLRENGIDMDDPELDESPVVDEIKTPTLPIRFVIALAKATRLDRFVLVQK